MARLNPIDCDALERALAMAKADPEMSERIAGRTWRDAAENAAHHYQHINLRLKPWESLPMYLDADDDADDTNAGGRTLLRRMLKAGLSRYEPDPLAALQAAGKVKA